MSPSPKYIPNNKLAGDEQAVRQARLDGLISEKRTRPRIIDLFCGAGGLTLGFSKSLGHCGLPVWANDINAYMVSTYNANFGDHCVVGDLNDLLCDPEFVVPQADIVLGGPPCQGFSLLNKQRANDPRKQLWRPYLEVVRRSGAPIFVMENVPPLIKSSEFEEIVAAATDMGFRIASEVLCAADYGVPQKRYRAVIVGCNFAEPGDVFPPKRTHIDPSNGARSQLELEDCPWVKNPSEWVTVREAISDLGTPVGTEIREMPPPNDLHFGRNPTPLSQARYRAIPEEGMNRFDLQRNAFELTPECWIRKKSGGTDLFGRLWWDRPALTIRTEFFKPEKGRYLHPTQHRPITHREAARFQSFPDDFVFHGSKVQIAMQIGNAVPPKLAARVADSVYALWLSRPRSHGRRILARTT